MAGEVGLRVCEGMCIRWDRTFKAEEPESMTAGKGAGVRNECVHGGGSDVRHEWVWEAWRCAHCRTGRIVWNQSRAVYARFLKTGTLD